MAVSYLIVLFCGLLILKEYSAGGGHTNTSASDGGTAQANLNKLLGASLSLIESSVSSSLKLKSRIYLESYCVNAYTAKEAEKLLVIDSNFSQEWWRPLNFPTTKPIAYPLCSAYPNLLRGTTVTINNHEFFQQKNIYIPSQPGNVTTRLHHFKYHPTKTPIWRRFLNCACGSMNSMYMQDELCQNGQIKLSRGVGGDTSFFIHKQDDKEEDIVVAHICFPQDSFKDPSKCRSMCRYISAGSKKIISKVNSTMENAKSDSASSAVTSEAHPANENPKNSSQQKQP